MKAVIAGGTGLIGRAVAQRFVSRGDDVVVLTRQVDARQPGVRSVSWDPDGSAGPWARELDGAGVVINLSGAGIADQRWTTARKEEIRSSRVLPTRSLVAAARSVTARPPVFIQGSGVGFYGASLSAQAFDESFPPGDDFLGHVCVAWEAEAHPVSALGIRLVILRTGLVLASDGGVLDRMRLPFMFFVGGPVASGNQYVSFVHRDDWIRMLEWALATSTASGAFNNTSPAPVTNREFMSALGRALRRPSWITVPRLALRARFGELADDLLVNGQRAIPKHALDMGFTFAHPGIDDALAQVTLGRR